MGNELVHPVQGPEKGGLTTSGGADESSDVALSNVDMDIFEGLGLTVIKMESPGYDLGSRIGLIHGNG